MENPPFIDSKTTPRATPVEENTPIIVSDEERPESIIEDIAIANNKDIAQSLQLKPNQIFLVNKYKTQAKGFKTSELRKIIQELEDLDYNYKIGLIDLNVGLESILCVYCS